MSKMDMSNTTNKANTTKKEYALNPYLPEYEYIPDGEPHVFGERVYIYGSHDRLNGKKFCLNDYVCYSADVCDLANWRYEGVIYKKTQDPRMKDGTHELWAPNVVKGKDGRYYLYYCPDDKIRSIGVAVCDTPAGQYEFYGIVQDKNGGYIGERDGDTIAFDPGVFIDDDGSIYLYSGNGPRTKGAIGKEPKASMVMKLADDMLTIISEPKKMLPSLGEGEGTGFEGHEFFEASSIRKINGKYYLVYSSVNLHELCYATSDRPDGDYKYGGVIVSNAEIHENSSDKTPKNCYGNNHGGLECIDGNYYIFYHRQTNRSMFSRQGCAEKIVILPDGRIPQAEMTSGGLNRKPLPGIGTYPTYCVANLHGKRPQAIAHPLAMGKKHPYLVQDGEDFPQELALKGEAETPRLYITNAKNGMVAVFRYFYCKNVTKISVKVRGRAKGKLVVLNKEQGNPAGEIAITPSKEWTTFSGNVNIPDGEQAIIFRYEGRGKIDFLEFTMEDEVGENDKTSI